MRLLGLETATQACSAALAVDGEVTERFIVEPRAHLRRLLPMVDELLAAAGLAPTQLDALAFGRGPGSFTGLRIAAGLAQGLALALDRPVVPVSNLATLALGAMAVRDAARVLVCQDARMNEVYWAAYRRGPAGMPERLGEEMLTAPEAVRIASGSWLATGSAWAVFPQLGERLAPSVAIEAGPRYPHAADVVRLAVAGYGAGEAVPAEEAVPVYLRDKVAWQRG